jgi:hypothetical protein
MIAPDGEPDPGAVAVGMAILITLVGIWTIAALLVGAHVFGPVCG